MNIPEMLMKCLANNETVGSIASALGLGREDTSKAVSASIPALLAAFAQTASSSQGAQQLANAAAQQDISLLDDPSGNITSRGSQLAQQGSSMLSSLLGGGQLSTLANILSRFTGLGEGAVAKILGMLGPLIMGFLGRQTAGLGAQSLMNLLQGQKDYIKGAMPSGLGGMLSSALPGLGDLLGGATRQTEAAAAAARDVYERPFRTSSPGRWLVPALVALALIALLLMWPRRAKVVEEPAVTQRTPTPVRPAPEAIGAPVRSAMGAATSANFVSETSRLIGDATKALTDVRDNASANAAVDKLKDINARLDSSRSVWTSLPDSTRTLAQSTFSPLLTQLESAIQPVLDMPAIGDMLRPHVNELLKNIRAFTSPSPVPTP